jgi:hypothetical protein
MENLGEKVSYLKGLCDGLQLDYETKEGKMIIGILDVLDEMAAAIEDLADEQFEMQELIDEIDEDLGSVEEEFYGECDCGCDCDCDDDEEPEFFELECPNCGEIICVDDSALFDDGVVCPNCNEEIDLDFDCDCDCEDCCE